MTYTSGRSRRVPRIGAGVLAAMAVLFTTVAPSTYAATPSGQDTTFAAGNAQTSLAEITIAGIALERSDNPQTRELASQTKTDHTAALKKLTAAAGQAGITLPGQPNTAQKADAATLRNVSIADFDATYAQIQVAGHQKSVASTNLEISTGQDPAIVNYAKDYLPTASMHLKMAEDLLASTGATPTAAPAGNGGQAAAVSEHSTMLVPWSILAAGMILLGSIAWARRRTAHS